jgi:protein TonB
LLERLRSAAGRRALGLGLTLAIEALLLLLLLFGLVTDKPPEAEEVRLTMVGLPAEQATEEPPEAREAKSERQARRPEPEEPRPPQPAEPAAPPPPAVILPTPAQLPPPAAAARPAPPAPARPLYGPPDNRPAAMRDTERVGTAPNGEPLYAASWYREPDDAMMRDYLSTARGPGWGLIACRTASDYRVEDCVALDEYPHGSLITRSALAAAWEFRVRPPRRGGRLMVGSWVRIRISYELGRR